MSSEDAGTSQVGEALRRLMSAVEDETRALRNRQYDSLEPALQAKLGGVAELMRLQRAEQGRHYGGEVAAMAAALRGALAENERVLAAHTSAVRDVVGVIAEAIEREGSDGTYERWRRNPRAS